MLAKAIIISLVAGAFTVSLFEYFFKYNLIDLIVEKIKGIFKKGETAVSSEAKKIEKKL